MFMSFFQEKPWIIWLQYYDDQSRSYTPVKSELGKTGVRYRGATIWNAILKDGINPDVSEAVFKKFLKKLCKTMNIRIKH